MKVFKLGITLFLYFTITACSSTNQVKLSPENNYYYAKNFSHHEFTLNEINSTKKSAVSDQELMLSLLNRPIPEDQRMMLVFSKRQEAYFPDSAIVGTQIRGGKHEENRTRVTSNYAHVIEHDVNAVNINSISK